MHNILETDSQKEHFIYHIYCVKVCTLSIKANYFRDTVGENNYTALCESFPSGKGNKPANYQMKLLD